MTPRQKFAISNPIEMDGNAAVSRGMWKRNGPWQSILTFEFQAAGDAPEELKVAIADGRVGLWHARTASFPNAPLAALSIEKAANCRSLTGALVARVGFGEVFWDDRDGMALHAFRWATTSEVAQALRSIEGRARRTAG